MRAIDYFGSMLAISRATILNNREAVSSLDSNHQQINHTKFRNVGYYVDWAIYNRSYYPTDVPASRLTHLHYAFAVTNTSGIVSLADEDSDIKYELPSHSIAPDGNLHGCKYGVLNRTCLANIDQVSNNCIN